MDNRFLVVLAALTFAIGCGSRPVEETGGVGLALVIPTGQQVEAISLDLACPGAGIAQSHTLDASRGEVIAAFGGLPAGACTVRSSTRTLQGAACSGEAAFTIVAGQTTSVLVTLFCQGVNSSEDGASSLSTRFQIQPCRNDRIKSLHAIPSNLLLGEGTQVGLELYTDQIVGTPRFSWSIRNDLENTATGLLEGGGCSGESDACQRVTCTGLGREDRPDPRTGLPWDGLFVVARLEDDDCFDTEELWIACLSAETCGNGVKQGTEECDDGNLNSDDGCSDTCRREFCGDGIVQEGLKEVCDGGPLCWSDCKIEGDPFCGDGLRQLMEECDGQDTPPGQLCGPDCIIVPICGNNIVEKSEQCDPAPNGNCSSCSSGTRSSCDECIENLPTVGDFYTTLCLTDPLCVAVMTCLQRSDCWDNPAPAACFCGKSLAHLDSCELPGFVPEGPCTEVIRQAARSTGDNSEVLGRFFDWDYPVGIATNIYDAAYQSGCANVCAGFDANCGNGLKQSGEACDDGNRQSGDGCSSFCTLETCGDGIVQTGLGEVCEGAGCAPDCRSFLSGERCGDQTKQATEECDGLSGLLPGQQCRPDCSIRPICGNGILERGESCDGALGVASGQVCASSCRILSSCGNGIVETGEDCDGGPECQNCKLPSCDACLEARLPTEVKDFNATACQPDLLCRDALACLLTHASCWVSPVPAACYCGASEAAVLACQQPDFVPTGACAQQMRAAAGYASNGETLNRYFDLDHPLGKATAIVDTAYMVCPRSCF